MAFKRRLKFDKRIKFKKQMGIMYILLFVVLASLGVGYAYIRSNLSINGTANIKNARWDIHFTNLNVTTGSVTAETAANITNDTTVEFAATLENPNDFYEFTVDVVNNSTLDAMIDSYSISPTLTTEQKKYLEYEVTYSDGTPLANKQELKVGATETLKVRFSYIENSDKTNYPTEDQTFTVEFNVAYTQADETAEEIIHVFTGTRYTVNFYDDNLPSSNSVQLSQAMPGGITQYTSAADALAAIRLATSDNSINFYLKHTISEGIVTESYVEFIVTPDMASTKPGVTAGTYTLRGLDTYDVNGTCKAEYYDSVNNICLSPYYESNKQTLLSVFGSGNCVINSVRTECSVSNFVFIAYPDGIARVAGNYCSCSVGYTGMSFCDYI